MKMPRLFKIVLLEESRKVGFGIWLFVVSIVFFAIDKLKAADFIQSMMMVWSLIGGGTIMDTYLKGKSGVVAGSDK